MLSFRFERHIGVCNVGVHFFNRYWLCHWRFWRWHLYLWYDFLGNSFHWHYGRCWGRRFEIFNSFQRLLLRFASYLIEDGRCDCGLILPFRGTIDRLQIGAAGMIKQIATPIVDPTKPITTSIEGIRRPNISATTTIAIVSGRNLDSGMYICASDARLYSNE
uniref:Uncharacterized protein n=1 Tax=Anopheles atroparvus TaxID=41427 RepID=A0A182IZP0_ANOAO